MSWLSIPLPNPFKSQPPDDEEDSAGEEEVEGEEEEGEEEEEESSPHGGVKEDLSELRKTIGRQLWGVASFLAPPPVASSAQQPPVDSTPTHDSSSQTLLGIRNDFAEIGGSFKSGLSLLSTNKAVNEISRLASNILLFPKDDDDEEGEDADEFSVEDHGGDIVGVTEVVLEFVREISMRPECWTDFPLSLENDFEMSDAQREHASTVEDLAPSLVALKDRLCPGHMNDGQFWMIYFILLHPRLNEHDSKLLSTPQIIKARESLLQKLHKRVNEPVESSKNDGSSIELSDKGTKIQEESNPVQEKEVLVETVNAHHIEAGELENTEQWLEEEDETDTSVAPQKQLENEEDVSFSDLEDDDDDDDTSNKQRSLNSEKGIGVSSRNDSNEWVRLSENSNSQEKKVVQTTSREKDSEGEESNDWLTIDDFD